MSELILYSIDLSNIVIISVQFFYCIKCIDCKLNLGKSIKD